MQNAVPTNMEELMCLDLQQFFYLPVVSPLHFRKPPLFRF